MNPIIDNNYATDFLTELENERRRMIESVQQEDVTRARYEELMLLYKQPIEIANPVTLHTGAPTTGIGIMEQIEKDNTHKHELHDHEEQIKILMDSIKETKEKLEKLISEIPDEGSIKRIPLDFGR